jgi:hypothetical protein
MRTRTEALRVIASVGFAVIMIADWRTANRWERQRSVSTPTDPLLPGR